MQNRKRWLAAVMAGVLLITPCAVFAEEAEPAVSAGEGGQPLPGTDSEYTAAYVKAVVDFLLLYTRYGDVTDGSLYKAGLMAALEAEPGLYEVVMRAMLGSIDENSAYFNPEEAAAFLSALSDSFAGIGIVSQTEDDRVYIQSVMADGPAQRAGLLPGDLIEAVDGQDVSALAPSETLAMLRGAAATPVEVAVYRVDTGEYLTFSMYRENILTPSVEYEVKEQDGRQVFYIRVRAFNDGTAKEFKTAMQKADEQGIKKIIVDVRNNGGGFLDAAVEMAEIFLPPGAVITTEEHKIELLNRVFTSGNSHNPDYDTVVLINGQSASSAEVFAAALRENGKAVLIGERSYGKGTVQNMKPLEGGSAIKYTAAYYLTPLGNNIHKQGLHPDALVVNTYVPVEMTDYQEFSYQNVLRWGDQDEAVRTAKELLALLGIYEGEMDAQFDTELDLAVRYFQRMTGLYAYGVLDITTQIKLWNSVRSAQKTVDEQLGAAMDRLCADV